MINNNEIIIITNNNDICWIAVAIIYLSRRSKRMSFLDERWALGIYVEYDFHDY